MKLSIIVEFLNLNKIECDIDILAINTLKDATLNDISFLENSKYIKDLENSKAGAVFVKDEFKKLVPKNCIAIIVEEPYLMMAKTSKLFAKELILENGNKPIIGEKSTIMQNVFIGLNSKIGNNTTILSGAYIGSNVTIGENCTIYPNVTIYNDTQIGNDVIIHAGTVIGSDGFGFAHTKDGKYIKIYHNGNVIIGNDVEIGSNTSIDRAVFRATKIGNGVRIDNLVHIAHNCVLKDGVILTGQVGLSGSTTLSEYVVMGGQSGTSGHLEVAPFTTIAARGGVTKSIRESKKFWAGFPLMEHKRWLKIQSKISNLLSKANN